MFLLVSSYPPYSASSEEGSLHVGVAARLGESAVQLEDYRYGRRRPAAPTCIVVVDGWMNEWIDESTTSV